MCKQLQALLYVAALQHDQVDLPEGTTLVGVVRKPTRWFHPAVDENRPPLGPPEVLLEAFEERQETLESDGLSDAEAHDAAWDRMNFAERYRGRLDASPEGAAAVDGLFDRLRSGEDWHSSATRNGATGRSFASTWRSNAEKRPAGPVRRGCNSNSARHRPLK